MMIAPIVFLSCVFGACAASEEHSRSGRARWPWETTMPSLATGKGRSSLHATAANMDPSGPAAGLPNDEGDTPVILRTPKAEGLAGDPVNDFQVSLRKLKESIAETQTLMGTAMRLCKEQRIQDCDESRHVLEVRGKMHRLMVAMKRMTELKPMAFQIRQLKRNATVWVKNSTTKLNAARISLSSVMLTREAIRAKLDSLEKVEGQWKSSMNEISTIVLKTKKDREDAEERAIGAENNRLDFLSKLEAILQGVDVGDKSAEITYERAERKLHEAEEREAKAKKRIFEAEELVDNAYHQQHETETNPDLNIEKVVKPSEPIVKQTEDGHHRQVDEFGRGSTSEHPLPITPHTLLAHSHRHHRVTNPRRHHGGNQRTQAPTPGLAKLQRQAMKLQEQLADLEAPLPEEEPEQVEEAELPMPPDML